MRSKKSLSSFISRKDGEIAELNRELVYTRASLTWKVGSMFRSVFDFLFDNRVFGKYYHGFIKNFSKKVLRGESRDLKKRGLFSRVGFNDVTSLLKKPISSDLSSMSFSNTILVVAELSIPQCKRYRVDQKVEAWESLGYEVFVFSFTDEDSIMQKLPFARMVLFYRTPYWEGVEFMLNECKRMGIPSVYDIDDLVFDIDEYKNHPVLNQLPKTEADNLIKGGREAQLCLSACDHAIASTRVLAEKMKKYNEGKIFILENALDDISLEILEYSKNHRKNSSGEVIIGYGSGTRAHDADFELIAPALIKVLKEFPEVKLVIQGYLILPKDLEDFSDRIERVDLLPASEYLQSLCDFDINLAPLTDSVFNDAKSNIKFLEAAALGIPTVASPADAFKEVMINGENGFLAANGDEWYQHLKRLVEDQEFRKSVSIRAQDMAMKLYSPKETEKNLSGILKDIGIHNSNSYFKKKQRVLFVNCFYAPLSFGGATLVVENLAENMVENYDVAVFTTNSFDNMALYETAKYEKDGVLVYSSKIEESSRGRSLAHLEIENIFEKVLQDFAPDVVHFHSIQGMGVGLLDIAKSFEAKVIVTAHDDWWFCTRQFRINGKGDFCGCSKVNLRKCGKCVGDFSEVLVRARVMQEALSKCDLILSPSVYQNELMAKNFPFNKKMIVNRNGINLPKPNYKHRKIEDIPIRFVFLGGIGALTKGYDLVKKAFEKIDQKNYELWIVDVNKKLGKSACELEKWRAKGKIKLVDPFSYEEMDDFYSKVDVLLAPSKWPESFGLAVREAAARGVYVVASKTGGVTEGLKNSRNSLLLPPNDLIGLVRVIEDLIEHPEKLSHIGLEKFEGFDVQAKDLTKIYERLLQG